MENLTLESLTNSFCIFGALMTLSEANALPLLNEGLSFQDLAEQTKIPAQILTSILDVLTSAGLITNENNFFKATGDLQKQIHQGGNLRISSNLKSMYGQIKELIDAAAEKRVQVGWHHIDESLLQAQGAFSEIVATDFIPASPKLKALAQKPGAKFLDVGAGVGRISLKMCELYPNLQAFALEPGNVPFSLAEKNIAASPNKNRIELLKIGVQHLKENSTFDIIWVALGFIIDEHFIPGLKQLKKALKPDGMLFIAAMSPDTGLTNKVKHFISNLHGAGRDQDVVVTRLKDAGFSNITEILQVGPYVVMTAESNKQPL